MPFAALLFYIGDFSCHIQKRISLLLLCLDLGPETYIPIYSGGHHMICDLMRAVFPEIGYNLGAV